TINVRLNRPPQASCPHDDTIFVCDLSRICVGGFTRSDPDSNYAFSEVIGGSLLGDTVCFTPVSGDNLITFIGYDACGAADTCQTNIHVRLNLPPTPHCPPETLIYFCDELDSVCLSGFTVTDPDGNLSWCTIDNRPYSPGQPFCFLPDSGLNELTLVCADSCGAQAACTVQVRLADTCVVCPSLTIEKTHNSLQGQHEFVDITMDSGSYAFGGFDILVSYDRSALTFQSVLSGDLHESCGWEYFTFRTWFDPSYDPHSFWGGIVRVVALADMNDGASHPACYQAPTPYVLATLDFLVTDNRLFECQFTPVSFFWTDCGDNTFSSVSGDSLFVSRHVFGFDLVGEMTDPATGFPTYTGTQVECLEGGGEGKPSPIQRLDFHNGGVDIACANQLDDRGDINLNGIAYEIADAVLFTSYFIFGQKVFTVNLSGQVAATDINADGLTLTVGDLVYLVRVIMGDALPYPKLTPVEATYTINGGVILVDAEMGA
ncbi:MAG: hypothetical protein AB1744_13490, partial [Candidatus Zixiibacteriota bacterium]